MEREHLTLRRILTPSTIYHWAGMFFIVLGVGFGGVLGGAIGALVGLIIIDVGCTNLPRTRKVLYSALAAVVGFIVFVVLGTTFLMAL